MAVLVPVLLLLFPILLIDRKEQPPQSVAMIARLIPTLDNFVNLFMSASFHACDSLIIIHRIYGVSGTQISTHTDFKVKMSSLCRPRSTG